HALLDRPCRRRGDTLFSLGARVRAAGQARERLAADARQRASWVGRLSRPGMLAPPPPLWQRGRPHVLRPQLSARHLRHLRRSASLLLRLPLVGAPRAVRTDAALPNPPAPRYSKPPRQKSPRRLASQRVLR